jgi:GTP cyclohydrolase II
VAGVCRICGSRTDADVLHWLGHYAIDRFVSMSDMKYNAIVNSGIKSSIALPFQKN